MRKLNLLLSFILGMALLLPTFGKLIEEIHLVKKSN
jgi:hypothetical protein